MADQQIDAGEIISVKVDGKKESKTAEQEEGGRAQAAAENLFGFGDESIGGGGRNLTLAEKISGGLQIGIESRHQSFKWPSRAHAKSEPLMLLRFEAIKRNRQEADNGTERHGLWPPS
jgi:hypothetical protein